MSFFCMLADERRRHLRRHVGQRLGHHHHYSSTRHHPQLCAQATTNIVFVHYYIVILGATPGVFQQTICSG